MSTLLVPSDSIQGGPSVSSPSTPPCTRTRNYSYVPCSSKTVPRREERLGEGEDVWSCGVVFRENSLIVSSPGRKVGSFPTGNSEPPHPFSLLNRPTGVRPLTGDQRIGAPSFLVTGRGNRPPQARWGRGRS